MESEKKQLLTDSRHFSRYLIFNVYYENNEDTIIKLAKAIRFISKK